MRFKMPGVAVGHGLEKIAGFGGKVGRFSSPANSPTSWPGARPGSPAVKSVGIRS